MTFVDIEYLHQSLGVLRQEWNHPESNAVLAVDSVLRPGEGERVARAFPSPSWEGWESITDSLQSNKMSCERIQIFPPDLASVVHELNSGPVISFLEELTGERVLLPDPHLWGGGLHCMEHGGYLWPHTDFLQGKHPSLKRRINLILFVHPNWNASMGGNFELWKRGEVVRTLTPVPGRCVIFRTDAHSTHGVSRISGHLPRESLALFYYSVTTNPDPSLDHTTGWRMGLAPDGSLVPRWKRLAAFLLMNTSFGLKRAAVFLNRKAEQIATSVR